MIYIIISYLCYRKIHYVNNQRKLLKVKYNLRKKFLITKSMKKRRGIFKNIL